MMLTFESTSLLYPLVGASIGHPANRTVWAVVMVLYVCWGTNQRVTGNHAKTTVNPFTKTICMSSNADLILRARHKTCFLRPDTGPCRADILQWYYDVRQKACYRFFWGGCQGNGNRFNTKDECYRHCSLSKNNSKASVPFFCRQSFEFGTCFGHFYRWYWDTLAKTCKRRLYSGCGGNQNNFESREECWNTCLRAPNNTFQTGVTMTTCIPFDIPDIL